MDRFGVHVTIIATCAGRRQGDVPVLAGSTDRAGWEPRWEVNESNVLGVWWV